MEKVFYNVCYLSAFRNLAQPFLLKWMQLYEKFNPRI